MRRLRTTFPTNLTSTTTCIRYAAAPASSSSAAHSPPATASAPPQRKPPPFTMDDIGLTQREYIGFVKFFHENYRNRPDAFIPARTINRQCKYTAGVRQQLVTLLQQGQSEQWLPSSVISPETKSVVASRLIVNTAFDDRKTSPTSSSSFEQLLQQARGGASGGNKTPAQISKQIRNEESLAQARRLAVEHFNWSSYWKSITNYDSAATSIKAATLFARAAEGHLSFFDQYVPTKQKEEIDSSSSNSGDDAVERIKSVLRLFATQGGAASQGGSWTWLVWNPYHGTKFSAKNRYGVFGEKLQQEEEQAAQKQEAEGEQKKKPKAAEGDDETSSSVSSSAAATAQQQKSEKSSKDEKKSDADDKKPSSPVPNVPKGGRLEIINTPFDVCPLEYGLFPVACINMTQRGMLAPPTEWSDVPVGETPFVLTKGAPSSSSSSAPPPPPSWSRAARNSKSILTRTGTLPKPGYQAFESIEKQRARFVDGVLSHFNWTMATEQLQRAMVWNESAEREADLVQHAVNVKEAMEERAKKILERKVSSDADVDLASALVEEQQQSAAAAAAEQEQQLQRSQQPEAEGVAVEAAGSEQQAVAAAASTGDRSNGDEQQQQQSVPEPTQCEDGTLLFEHADGTQEFKHPDGKRTVNKPDGTVEWHNTAEDEVRLTRRFPDGKEEFFYANGDVVQWFADGRQVRTSPGGETHETIVPREQEEA